ncbi:hypothetical protein BpHYR1_050028 [Brachionus plicatilis]|uniref:Uncharacterized protein n=1 Tax=Brachionus plicatilis TaxID=10195 RepID=A0A3M7S138_BRAPC|nr:hypothetical protein BpHYR1_050028 [Brachionus plicatilis]
MKLISGAKIGQKKKEQVYKLKIEREKERAGERERERERERFRETKKVVREGESRRDKLSPLILQFILKALLSFTNLKLYPLIFALGHLTIGNNSII